jgi:hypothetical protein
MKDVPPRSTRAHERPQLLTSGPALGPGIRDQVADDSPTLLASHEDAQMGREPGPHRLSRRGQLAASFDPCLHQGDIWPDETDVLSHEGVASGHDVRQGENVSDDRTEFVPTVTGHPENVRPVRLLRVIAHGQSGSRRSHAFIQFSTAASTARRSSMVIRSSTTRSPEVNIEMIWSPRDMTSDVGSASVRRTW